MTDSFEEFIVVLCLMIIGNVQHLLLLLHMLLLRRHRNLAGQLQLLIGVQTYKATKKKQSSATSSAFELALLFQLSAQLSPMELDATTPKLILGKTGFFSVSACGELLANHSCRHSSKAQMRRAFQPAAETIPRLFHESRA